MEEIFKYYEENYNEDGRLVRDKSHSIEYLTTIRYFDKIFNKNSRILDPCAGTGAYSFYLAKRGHRVVAGDLVPYNVSNIEKKQDNTPILEEIYTGSILDLSKFKDNSFDVVLCMGAFYHLKEEELRKKALKESLRVLKEDGILVVSYINKNALVLCSARRDIENMDKVLEVNRTGSDSLFYGITQKNLRKIMKDLRVKPICNIATDGVGYIVKEKINSFSEEDFNKWLYYHFENCEDESLLGYSIHGLYFGVKV